MICQHCNQRAATVHFTKIEQGEKTEIHLCEPCARERGEFIYKTPGGLSINNLLSGLMSLEQQGPASAAQAQVRCPTCGLTYKQFSQVGRFGCADCYKHFSSRLQPLLRRIHGSTSHTGKVPSRIGGSLQQKRQLHELRAQLQETISQERFEEAAVLRDRIRELEQSLGLEG